MAHFYGTVQGTRGKGSRIGTKNSGLSTVAASWGGAIEVIISHDPATGRDTFRVLQRTWEGKGVSEEIAHGTIGEPTKGKA